MLRILRDALQLLRICALQGPYLSPFNFQYGLTVVDHGSFHTRKVADPYHAFLSAAATHVKTSKNLVRSAVDPDDPDDDLNHRLLSAVHRTFRFERHVDDSTCSGLVAVHDQKGCDRVYDGTHGRCHDLSAALCHGDDSRDAHVQTGHPVDGLNERWSLITP